MTRFVIRSIRCLDKETFWKPDWGVQGGTIVSGVSLVLRAFLNCSFLLIIARLLGTFYYGSFSVLYSGFTIISFILGQAAETSLTKYVAEARSSQTSYAVLLSKATGWLSVLSLILIVSGFLARDIVVARLFPEAPYLFYFLLGIGILESWDMALRGILRGMRAIGMYAVSVMIQMSLRLVLGVLLTYWTGGQLVGTGVGIFVAMAISVLVTICFLRHLRHYKVYADIQYDTTGISKYLASMIATFCLMAFYYHSGPLLIKIQKVEFANELAGMFMVAAYFSRVLLQLSEPLTINLLPRLSGMDVQGNADKAWHYIVQSYQLIVPWTLLSVIGLYFFGPWVVRTFHREYLYSNTGMGMLGLNSAFMTLHSIASQLLLSRSKTNVVVMSWLVGCVILTMVSLLGLLWSVTTRLEIGYVASSALMLGIVLCGAFLCTHNNKTQ